MTAIGTTDYLPDAEYAGITPGERHATIASRAASVLICLLASAIGRSAYAADHPIAHAPTRNSGNFSLYVTAEDGTRIAVDVWLPGSNVPGQRVPALIKGTPYWRARELTALGREKAPTLASEPDVPILNARGYAVVAVDARGTGASFGSHQTLFSDAEVSDYGSIADWIIEQPWSNGRVGAYGFSYRGMTAANIASLPNREIKAVAPLFDLTDLYLLTHPGGVLADYLVHAWSDQTQLLNSGKVPCNGDRVCEQMIAGPKPVDEDTDHRLLRQALAEHRGNFDVYRCIRAAVARDDKVCRSGSSLTDTSVLARKPKIETRGLPMFVLTGWLDQTSPAQVLFRYQTFSNPQQVVIGPFTHGGFAGDDPFLPDRPLDMPYKQQTELMADFFDGYLKDTAEPISKSIRFYVMGAHRWELATTWPPKGTVAARWYLEPAHGLARSRPRPGADKYIVDFTATTGKLSGYRGQVDLSKTDYGNRAAADTHLLVYTSAAVGEDVEIVGNPVAHLRLASTASDGVVIVYLEDVAPDGRVTYLSQGVLRLAFRRLATDSDSGYSADPYHGYRRADLAPMPQGELQDLVIAIWPIAALVRKGHELRVAIAGADAVNLERIPANGRAALTVERGESYVDLPYQLPRNGGVSARRGGS